MSAITVAFLESSRNGRGDETCTSEIPALGRGRCRPAGHLARCNRPELSDAADHDDRAVRCGRSRRCSCEAHGRANETVARASRYHRREQTGASGSAALSARGPTATRLILAPWTRMCLPAVSIRFHTICCLISRRSRQWSGPRTFYLPGKPFLLTT
jgi:hypothetical protein